jgi:hypothetical protein
VQLQGAGTFNRFWRKIIHKTTGKTRMFVREAFEMGFCKKKYPASFPTGY